MLSALEKIFFQNFRIYVYISNRGIAYVSYLIKLYCNLDSVLIENVLFCRYLALKLKKLRWERAKHLSLLILLKMRRRMS